VETTAFFGSFVSLFVNQSIGAAERSIRFRSQALRVPEPPPEPPPRSQPEQSGEP
jgi:hypothetical protein